MMREGGIENESVKKHGFEVTTFPTKGFSRREPISFCTVTLKSVRKAIAFIEKYKPDIIFGTGGYVSFAPALSGILLGIPVFIHESNVIPGLVTKIMSKLGAFVLLSCEETIKYLPKNKKSLVVGTPLLDGFNISKAAARRKMKLNDSDILIVSFGGSGGAKKINEIMLEVMKQHSAKSASIKHIHATGRSYFNELEIQAEKFNGSAFGCMVVPYIDDMPDKLRAADIAVCRAGALTLTEAAASGCAAILIPSPNVADDHQRKNAERLKEKSAAIVIDEEALNAEKIIAELSELEKSKEKRQKLSRRISETVITDATEKICTILLNRSL